MTETVPATRAGGHFTYGFLIGTSIVLIVIAALGDAAVALGLMQSFSFSNVLLAAGGGLALIGAL